MEEVWIDIKGFEGRYQVSNCGRVRNVKFGRYLSLCETSFGYYQVYFNDENGKTIGKKVARLVMESFVPNPLGLPQIDHKDGDKKNNFVWVNPDGSVDLEKSNLEWVSASENITRSIKGRKKRENPFSPVTVLKNGKIIKKCRSIAEAARFIGCGKTSVQRVLNSDYQNTIYGFTVIRETTK